MRCAVCGETASRVVAGYSLCWVHSESLMDGLTYEVYDTADAWFRDHRKARLKEQGFL